MWRLRLDREVRERDGGFRDEVVALRGLGDPGDLGQRRDGGVVVVRALHASLYGHRLGEDRLKPRRLRERDSLVGGDPGRQIARRDRVGLGLGEELIDLRQLRRDLRRWRERRTQRADVRAARHLVELLDDAGGLYDHELVRLGKQLGQCAELDELLIETRLAQRQHVFSLIAAHARRLATLRRHVDPRLRVVIERGCQGGIGLTGERELGREIGGLDLRLGRRVPHAGHPLGDAPTRRDAVRRHEACRDHRGGDRDDRTEPDRDAPALCSRIDGQCGEQLVHRAEPLRRIDRDRAERYVGDAGRYGRGHDRRQRVPRRHELLRVRPLAGERFEQHDAERELIAARVGAVTVEQLGRHVRRRADHAVDEGEVGRGRHERIVIAGRWDGVAAAVAREPEIHHPHAAVLADDHVFGLEVAMHELRVMCSGEPGAGGEHDVAHLAPRAVLDEPRAQRDAVDQLHRDEHLIVGHHADIVDDHDVGMR